MRIAVVGLGYVGLANAIMLAQNHDVRALDISAERVALVNARRSPIRDEACSTYLESHALSLTATTDPAEALGGAEIVFIATPTNFDDDTKVFDTSSVEAVIALCRQHAPEAQIVIKSTVPVGFTEEARRESGYAQILFSPEFLREGQALHDTLHPTRIVVGGTDARAHKVADLLKEGAVEPDCPVLFTGSTEAEAIKLFANTYLALRVAYFNELDSYAMSRGLDTRQIIDGVGLDPRIGNHYNNPSFGYGGYCLPKDTKQLLANYHNVPQNLIAAVVDANRTRKEFVADQVAARNPKTVGIYRLVMKNGSDNFRESSVLSIMSRLRARGIEIIVYEPALAESEFAGARVIEDFAAFSDEADVIIANRRTPDLKGLGDKVFSRDLFGVD
ncbi:nucleotide sugar dehydrogenase [Rhodobacter sp. NTK016B]|uniref:nucleotide sugar dehydrogenase n=1 Tax=Rhodobacter sp. NTK016B TaxID=2759676 RepID=UPI001A8FDE5E|nr:nucleotide sugar dehydrogenase [Rhodobacter sp. NTK016B]MBN8293724.1 nucleotide sugar dehydrogenase [Rhodobacter sp. NTK016B]